MGRYTGAVCRLCRRQGEKLFLKGTKCQTEKCAVNKRAYPPGQHGEGKRKKLSNYGMQLKEKQNYSQILKVYTFQPPWLKRQRLKK